jgi:type VI secretion system secreted protein Hcp
MPAYLQLQGSKGLVGEATDSKHPQWVLIQTMSAPIHRSIPEGAKDQQRARGETTLGDIVVVRELDNSSTKLQEACADGTFFGTAFVEFCSTIGGSQEWYLRYELENVIITSYNVHCHESGQPVPTEEITLAYTAARWKYRKLDHTAQMAHREGPVGSYNPGLGRPMG